LEYDPILIVCFEGLLEREHPYNFAARQCVKEMLQAPGTEEKVLPILSKLINPIRMAFASNDNEIFEETLTITHMVN
jgi:hypothetical protein